MPHFSIEYSANLEEKVDMSAFCEMLRVAGLKTGVFPEPGIRVRAIACQHYAIADGAANRHFIDVSIRLRGGRPMDVRKRALQEVFAAAEAYLATALETFPLALSFEMRDIDPELSPKTNSIRNFISGDANV